MFQVDLSVLYRQQKQVQKRRVKSFYLIQTLNFLHLVKILHMEKVVMNLMRNCSLRLMRKLLLKTLKIDDLPAYSGDYFGENSPLIDIALTSKTTKRPGSDNTKRNKEKEEKNCW